MGTSVTSALSESVALAQGLPEAIGERFWLQREFAVPGSERLFMARSRDDGRRCWLLCPGQDAGSLDRISTAFYSLGGLEHPLLLTPQRDQAGSGHYLSFAYEADAPLTEADLETFNVNERLRLAAQLVKIVDWLQSQTQPIAHLELASGFLWVSSGLKRLRLGGFMGAVRPASQQDLKADRVDAQQLILRIINGSLKATSIEELESALRTWVEQGSATAAELLLTLQKLHVAEVMADL
jgi:hypothetical protein